MLTFTNDVFKGEFKAQWHKWQNTLFMFFICLGLFFIVIIFILLPFYSLEMLSEKNFNNAQHQIWSTADDFGGENKAIISQLYK